MKLKKTCACLLGLLLTVICTSFVIADENVTYSYTNTASIGSVRYISQIISSKYFNSAYWGKWDGNTSIKCANGTWYGGPIQECLTSCMSMSLSYIGVNKTPEDILNFGSGITIVNTNWGGASYKSSSFTKAMDNYLNGNGKYSPPIIHLNNYSSAGHYVVVIEKLSGNKYKVVDPARESLWEITINGTTATYTMASGATKTDTVTSAQQYYKASSEIIKPFLSCLDTPNSTDTYSSDIIIGGWAIYGKGITKVEGTINGNAIRLTQISRADVANIYPGYPTGREGFTGIIPATLLKNGSNQLELNAYYNDTVFNIASMNVYYKNEIKPTISDVQVEKGVDGYTITCQVSDDVGIDRVQFPTWTEANGQDDIDKKWSNSEQSRGTIENGKVSFRVNISEHNNEIGKYCTHIYAYDIHGNYSVEAVTVEFDTSSPEISDITVMENSKGFSVYCYVIDESEITNVNFEIYRYDAEDYELLCSGEMKNQLSLSDENQQAYMLENLIEVIEGVDNYRIDIQACDIYGNESKISYEINLGNLEISPELLCTEEFNRVVYEIYDLAEMSLIDASWFCIFQGGEITYGESDEELEFLNPIIEKLDKICFICRYPYSLLNGDVDFDGVVSATDALIILKHAANIDILQEKEALDAADCDNDGAVTALDALIVLKIAANLE